LLRLLSNGVVVAAPTTTSVLSTTPQAPCPNPDDLAVYDHLNSDYLTLEYPVDADVVLKGSVGELALPPNQPQEILLESHDATHVDFMELSFSVKYAKKVTLELTLANDDTVTETHLASTNAVS